MHTMQNVQNMQNSLLLTERTSALWAVYGYFQNLSGTRDTLPFMANAILNFHFVFYPFPYLHFGWYQYSEPLQSPRGVSEINDISIHITARYLVSHCEVSGLKF